MPGAYDLQLAWFASFVAVAEHGSFTGAARASYRSQPRVSMHVAALERALGVRLLDRSGRGVRLTEAGARLVPHARAMLADLRAGVDSVGSLAGQLHGHVTVGSYPGASAVLLAPLVKRFRERHPGVTVDLREGHSAWLEGAVAHAEIDMAIRAADVPQRYHDISSRPLLDEPIVLVVAPDHPLAAVHSVDPRSLADEPVVVTGEPSIGWVDYQDRLVDVGVAPERVVTVGEPTTVIAMVRAGLGVGVLGALAAEVTVYGDLVVRDLPPDAWHRQVRVYLSTRRRLSAPAAAFLEELTTTASEPVTPAAGTPVAAARRDRTRGRPG